MQPNRKDRTTIVLQYLWQFTDEDHTVTLADIANYLATQGLEANRHTLSSDIDKLSESGYDIICVREKQNRYFIGERVLQLPELKLLVDAVEAARFIPEDKSRELINNLSKLVSTYDAEHLKRDIYLNSRVKTSNSNIYYLVHMIETAIQTGKRINFQYFSYSQTKEKIPRFDGYTYDFSPHKITWSNDSYYVIGYYTKRHEETVYRIDRMQNLKICEEDALPMPEGFDVSEFLKSTFLMFGGDEQTVTLLCDISTMNNIIDKFGEDVETHYDEARDPEHFEAVVNVAVGPTFYSWVFNYMGKIRIISPESVCDGFQDMLSCFKKADSDLDDVPF